MASTVSVKGSSAGSPTTSAKTYMVVPSGDTRPDRWPMAASGLSTWPTLSGASGPDSQEAISAAASYAADPRPAGSRNTMRTGVPVDGKRSRANSNARVASASLGRKSACSFSLASSSRGSCEIKSPAAMIQVISVTHLPRGLETKSVRRRSTSPCRGARRRRTSFDGAHLSPARP